MNAKTLPTAVISDVFHNASSIGLNMNKITSTWEKKKNIQEIVFFHVRFPVQSYCKVRAQLITARIHFE